MSDFHTPDMPLPSLQGAEDLQWSPTKGRVQDAIQDGGKAVDDATKRFESLKSNSGASENKPAGMPNTEEDKAVAEAAIHELREKIDAVSSRIAATQKRVDVASGVDGSGDRFVMNIEKRRPLKRAMRKIFGGKHDVITPEHYKEAIRMKAEIEDSSARKHTKGK
jgi:hypothetical protein